MSAKRKGTIDNWSTTPVNPYAAPETIGARPRVQGVLRETGKQIMTSAVAAAAGRAVTTVSGSVYGLGKIDPKFRAWMTKEGISYDHRTPIRVKRVRQ